MNLSRLRSLVRLGLSRSQQNSGMLYGENYVDEEIDELINDAYRTFCHDTGILTAKRTITLTDGIGTLDPDTEKIKRVEVGGVRIKSIDRSVLEEEIYI